MTVVGLLRLYNVVVGFSVAAGLGYLLYAERYLVGYRRFVTLTTAGLLIFTVISPLTELLVPSAIHVVHGVAAVLVVVGLYDPLHEGLRTDAWAELALRNPLDVRQHVDWMAPMDDPILDLVHSSHLVLTPAVIAYNTDYSREEVNRRLIELETHGLVERVGRGKYRITAVGERYRTGEAGETDGTTMETADG